MTDKATPTEKGMPEEEPTISKQLFPEVYEQPQEITPAQEITPVETKPSVNAKVEGAVVESQSEITPAPVEAQPSLTDDYLDIEAVKGKKVKLKVDGQEMEVPFEELVKNHQTWQHLSRVGRVVGEQRKSLVEERAELERLRRSQAEDYLVTDVPSVNDEVVALKAEVVNLRSAIQPTLAQMTLERADSDLKHRGLNDFKSYVPKIREFILANVPAERQGMYDNIETFVSMYQEMKLDDMVRSSSTPTPPVKPLATTPKIVPPIESASAPTNVQATSQLKKDYEAAYKRAQESGDVRLWGEAIKLKEMLHQKAAG